MWLPEFQAATLHKLKLSRDTEKTRAHKVELLLNQYLSLNKCKDSKAYYDYLLILFLALLTSGLDF